MSTDRDEKIRQRAYDLWERDGAQHGRDQDYWHQATAEIDAEERDAKSPPKKAPARARKSSPKMPAEARTALKAAEAAAKAHGVELADVVKSKKSAAKTEPGESGEPTVKGALRKAKSSKS